MIEGTRTGRPRALVGRSSPPPPKGGKWMWSQPWSSGAVGNLLVIKNQDEFGAGRGPSDIGAYSLAIKFDGRTGRSVRFKVPLCSSGGVDVGFKHLKARIRMSEPGAPAGTGAHVTPQVMTTDVRDRAEDLRQFPARCARRRGELGILVFDRCAHCARSRSDLGSDHHRCPRLLGRRRRLGWHHLPRPGLDRISGRHSRGLPKAISSPPPLTNAQRPLQRELNHPCGPSHLAQRVPVGNRRHPESLASHRLRRIFWVGTLVAVAFGAEPL